MTEEEKIIEINIQIDKPIIVLALLIIIVTQTIYIGYLRFYPKKVMGEVTDNAEHDNLQEIKTTNNTDSILNITSLEKPKSFEEIKSHLIAVGCKNIILWDKEHWQGKHLEVTYTEALKLASISPFVGVDEDTFAFIFLKDGEIWIYFIT